MHTNEILRDAAKIAQSARNAGLITLRHDAFPQRKLQIQTIKTPGGALVPVPPPLFGERNNRLARQIIAAVAIAHGLTLTEIYSKARPNRISHPRQLAMYLIKKLCHLSHDQIGDIIGGHHRGTSLFAFDKLQLRYDRDTAFRQSIEQWLAYDYTAIKPETL